MQKPLVPLVIALMAGIVAGYRFWLPTLPLLIVLLLVMAFLFLSLRLKRHCFTLPLASAALLILGAININFFLFSTPDAGHIVYKLNNEKQTIMGVIDDAPQESPDGRTIVIDARAIVKGDDCIPAHGLVMLSMPIFDCPLKYGDLVRVKARLRAPRNFHNPGGFDYEKQLRGRGILVQGRANNISDIVRLREDCGNPFKTGLEKIRSKLRQFITDNSTTPEREIIQALVLGETKPIAPEVRESFSRTGTSHILAISGFNVGIVVSFFVIFTMLIMKPFPYLLLRFNLFKVSTLIAMIPVAIYTFIAGLGVSVIRAAIMIMAFLVAILLRKERDLFNTLALAALIILMLNPTALFDVSFQLTFAAVASLIYVSPLITNIFLKREKEETAKIVIIAKKSANYILILILTTLSATLGTLPFVVYYFNGISTVSLPANCIAVPIMGVIAFLAGMASVIAAPFSSALAAIMIKFTSVSIKISLTAITFLSSLPGAYLSVTTPSLLEIACYYLFFIVGIKILEGKLILSAKKAQGHHGRAYYIALFALIAFFIIDGAYLNLKDHFRENLQVTAIDVGQGSSTLIRLPAGKNILIDGGGSASGNFDVGKYVVAPYLWKQRISRLEAVVLTHPHPDHLQGLLTILERFNINEVWTNGYTADVELYNNFLRLIKERGIIHRVMDNKTKPMTINGATIRILNPESSLDIGGSNTDDFQGTNDSSLVIKLAFKEISFLFPGDISGNIEKRLIEENADMKSDVLFVPHHGGFTSSTPNFLHTVLPRIAVVSCGKDNVFRLPHPDVMKRYASLRARVLRTDLDGAVTISTDGKQLTITTAIDKK